MEAARAGYRILVAANNPIARFLLELSAKPPTKIELQAALADLASSYRGSERIEIHIRNLYTIPCAHCQQLTEVDAYIWEKSSPLPYAALYTCPYCNESGEHALSQAAKEKALPYSAGGLHQARALERVAPTDDPDRSYAEEALSVYLPRSVYTLFTLINKLAGLSLSPDRHAHLAALLLTACDEGNTLWAYPTVRERPKQLTTSAKYRENNLWNALEHGIEQWAAETSSIPLSIWPQLPPESGGICIFEGRLKELEEQRSRKNLPLPNISACITNLPRPNQAFWTLSALWAGWLWGREAAAPFKTALRRRRYDWAWHTTALSAAFDNLANLLEPGVPVFALTGEAEPGMLTSAMIAANISGFELKGAAVRFDTNQAQIHWQRASESTLVHEELHDTQQMANEAAKTFLEAYGNPAGYFPLYTAALMGTVSKPIFGNYARSASHATEISEDRPTPSDVFLQIQNNVRDTLTYRRGFLHLNAGETPESGLWWYKFTPENMLSIVDRVEKILVNFLVHHPPTTYLELERIAYDSLGGLLTPSAEIIQICLESYAIQSTVPENRWGLRTEDMPPKRREELQIVREQIISLGKQLGYTVRQDTQIEWANASGKVCYSFYPIASGIVSEIMLRSQPAHTGSVHHSVIVLPGGRGNLVAYKLHHDPRLSALVTTRSKNPEMPIDTTSWLFIKYRHLRWMIDNPLLSQENFIDTVRQDPMTYSEPQMRLL